MGGFSSVRTHVKLVWQIVTQHADRRGSACRLRPLQRVRASPLRPWAGLTSSQRV